MRQMHIIQLGDISYYVRSRVEWSLPEESVALTHSPVPATVIRLPTNAISIDLVQTTLEGFLAGDDVFQESFTENGLLIITSEADVGPMELPEDLSDYLDSRLLSPVYLADAAKLPQGPYFALNGKLHQAWRLYPDSLSAFTAAVIPDDEAATGFQSFGIAGCTDSTSAVPVPSRLYAKQTPEQPLAGMRITLKDNIHLKGVVTTLGNRSYAELYGKQATSASYVDLLIQKGAFIVGKTKISAFAGSEVPPVHCIDYFPPWNPRGDGYQGPSGSASGAAASVAGYPWVDIGLCTDTTGGMRYPASSHGVWGHRATWDSLPMENIVPHTPVMDALGILSKSPSMIQSLLESSKSWNPVAKATEILYPTDWYPCHDENQQRMTEEFLSILETYLGIKCTRISLMEQWSQTAPEHVRNQPLAKYLRGISNGVRDHDGYHSFDDFRREYEEKFGRPPYISPLQQQRWAMGAGVSDGTRDEYFNRMNVFKAWFEEHVWNVEDDTMKVMIVPQGRPGANYRDGTEGSQDVDHLYNHIVTTTITGGPQIVVPIGQNKYHSAVSHQTEYAPIMATLLGPKDSDLCLLSIAEGALKSAGCQSDLLTGRNMLHVGDNVRNAQ